MAVGQATLNRIQPITVGSRFVDATRLWQRHVEMGRIGATPKGGVNRQALSPEDAKARSLLASWARARGFGVFTDRIGNLFVRREGTDASARPVLTGSHLDTQPTGGRYDGAYGVLAGFEVLEALEDGGVKTRRPLELVAWTNEEGSRFQPGAMGSAVFAGTYDLAKMLAVTDRAGVVLRDALAQTLAAAPATPRTALGFPVDGYVEAHIEQGPILEATGNTIGVVTMIQGSRRFTVDVVGEEAHAGTTPRRARKDALSAAVKIVSALEDLMRDDADVVRFTVGRFEVYPGSPNTVPGRVHFTIDFRHPDAKVVRELGDRVAGVANANAKGCAVTVTDISYVEPTVFAKPVVDLVRDTAEALGLKHMDMPSGAGHDAMHMNALCPTGMIFVPCLRGISHNEAESATAGDLAAGCRVLADALVALANR
ncbi:MAG TPA: M20 family metallo-hydrolase [Alphaproteobacteria bacterium]|nr:M20 family metallo-hydrolase [Alphaproteobacteria bacterium]